MHHRVFDDGSLVVQDGFGITRLTPDGRARTLATAVWNPWLRLATLGPEAAVLARVGATRALRRVTLDDLRAAPRPEDLYAVAASRDLTARWSGRVALNTRDRLRPRVVVNAGILHPATASLGPSRGDDGTLAGVTPGIEDPELTLLDPSHDDFAPRWRVPVRAGNDTVLVPYRTRRGVTLVGWRPRAADATILGVDEDGAPTTRHTVACHALPAVDEGRALYQPDPAHLASLDLETGTVSTIALVDPAHHGPGLPIAGRGRSFFIPWHAELILDLDRGVAFRRGLSPAQRARRATFTRWMVDHASPRLAAGLLFPMRIQLGRDPQVMFWEPLASPIDQAATVYRALRAALA